MESNNRGITESDERNARCEEKPRETGGMMSRATSILKNSGTQNKGDTNDDELQTKGVIE